MININELLNPQKAKIGRYQLYLIPLDQHCSSIKIQIKQNNDQVFEETFNVYDFVDAKTKLKEGIKLEVINSFSLLFLKLMIKERAASQQFQLVQMCDLPWKKVYKGEQKIKQKIIKRTPQQQVKGIGLVLSKNLAIVIPLLLVQPPKVQLRSLNIQKEKDTRIKQLFYGQLKSTDLV